MKSGRYEILPRIRKLISAKHGVYYVCTWRDPGELIQVKGAPLRWVRQHQGLGYTPDEAIRSCRDAYLKWCVMYGTIRDGKIVEDRWKQRVPYTLPPRLQATSNLPWWKRLFRV